MDKPGISTAINPSTPADSAGNAAALSDEVRKRILTFMENHILHEGDFPALSESIGYINRIASSDRESISSLSNAILKDFSLTTKLLKLVNSATYAQYGGGNISTVSRAVSILGFDAIKSIAIALILFEHLKSQKQAARLKNEFLRVLFCGVVARDLSQRALARGPEEAFICAMFHNLGRLLGMFYFPDEAEETRAVMAQKKIGEDAASLQVLGLSYREVGMAVASDWRFPEQIVYSMGALPAGPVSQPVTNMDKLLMLAVFADELSETIARTPCEGMPEEIRKIVTRFADGLSLTEIQLHEAIERTIDEVIQYANIIQLNLRQTPFGSRISRSEGDDGLLNVRGCAIAEEPHGDGVAEAEEQDALTILAASIRDASAALVDEKPLNDVLRIVLETLYRGLGFRHVLLCTISSEHKNIMKARFGFGPQIETLIPNFKFSLNGGTDVFQTAVASGADIVIANIDDPRVHDRIPEWYRQATTARAFVLFPLIVRKTPVALIYAEKELPGEIHFSDKGLSLLHSLRNHALLAIKQSRG